MLFLEFLSPQGTQSVVLYFHTTFSIRDGPLENLWGGGGGAGEVQKKNSRKGKLNEKKFLQAN